MYPYVFCGLDIMDGILRLEILLELISESFNLFGIKTSLNEM